LSVSRDDDGVFGAFDGEIFVEPKTYSELFATMAALYDRFQTPVIEARVWLAVHFLTQQPHNRK